MGQFPAGGWDLDDCDDLALWVPSIKAIPPTKSLQEVSRVLRTLASAIAYRLEPEEFEDEGSDEDLVQVEDVPPVNTLTIKSRPKMEPHPATSSSGVVPEAFELVPTQFPVSIFVLLLSSFWYAETWLVRGL